MAEAVPPRGWSARVSDAWGRLVRDDPDRVAALTSAARRSKPARWRWAGVAASLALAAASWGAGARPELNQHVLWPGVAWWRDTGGSPLLATVALLAMVGFVVAWWRLRWARVTVGWWQTTAALWFAPLVASVPLYSRDLYSYAAQGLLWSEGLSPYDHTVRELDSDWRLSTAPTWLDTPTPYGPVWLLLARGVASMSGGHLWVALLLLRLLAVVGVVVIAWAVPDVARRLGTDPARATWLAVACPLVGVHFVSGAHNDALMVAAVLGGLALALRGRFVTAAVVVALGAMVKVTAVVALPFLALLWARHALRRSGRSGPLRWPGVVRAGALTLLAAGVVMAAGGLLTRLGFAWLNPGATPGRNEQWTSLPTGVGIAVQAVGTVLGQDGWREPAVDLARTVGLVVLAVLLVLVWLGAAKPAAPAGPTGRRASGRRGPGRRAASDDTARTVRALGWGLLAVVVLAPVFLPWYFLWVLPVLAVSLAPSWERAEKPLAVLASVVCFMTLPEGYSLGLSTTAVGVPLDLVALGVLLTLAWRTGRRVDPRLLDLSRPLLRRRSAPERADRQGAKPVNG
ncbi:polyprenol phosphomannose-dependent alpha 1,6 mannosyltransferase MptB [Intrasporangium sp. YIM S08009]|uniref:polyprenol phosphomannose-dependent alpha 1,6 mannosyltransferase MptB n=1 Tax=Intrasporangium zincisolvens TaxID=3080018 RepID=UPI002B05D121|nr:polyprenol phosphomannose-dependent alpha 1,6 mannosyltransferase MptB [Intrasporangium sp. YIM S08009]